MTRIDLFTVSYRGLKGLKVGTAEAAGGLIDHFGTAGVAVFTKSMNVAGDSRHLSAGQVTEVVENAVDDGGHAGMIIVAVSLARPRFDAPAAAARLAAS